MVVETYAQNAVVVDLPPLPEAIDEFEAVIEIACDRRNCDVVIDFSRVDIINSQCIALLLAMHAWLTQSGRRLILSSVCGAVKRVFEVIGLDEVFEFTPDKSMALKQVHRSPSAS